MEAVLIRVARNTPGGLFTWIARAWPVSNVARLREAPGLVCVDCFSQY